MTFEHFETTMKRGMDLARRIENSKGILPSFTRFCDGIRDIFEECRPIKEGKKATYIPQLAISNENYWAIAVETVDGRTYSYGDSDVEFSLQSCSKPLIYSLAVEELGAEEVIIFIIPSIHQRRLQSIWVTNHLVQGSILSH